MFHGTWAVIKKLCAIIFVVELFCGKFSALKFLKMQFSLTRCLLEYALDFLTEWHAVASWTWDAQDETCGICRMAFDGCCPDCKLPGDDCPLKTNSGQPLRLETQSNNPMNGSILSIVPSSLAIVRRVETQNEGLQPSE
ncbi:anaphase-promoting complex subunit 11 [Populus alba x Populus x berolinensis]|uniref:Anaphase-promoting complex subunit 11 n=1 Tax=Populus alba x Populus x berolinensis TaxID=444605 RepID=A0AAD6LEM6_9ROSI|nr:anaphase-promoting complex subunit 11 [Populus alba x Populus x berolinensis]